MRAWDEGLDFRSLVPAEIPQISARVNVGEVFDLGAYTRHVDVVFSGVARRCPRGRRLSDRPRTSRAGRSREIYGLDDETLVLAR